LIHPRDNRIKIAAAYDVPFAADVQAADESDHQDSKLPLTIAFLFSVGPSRAG
jgi:hypothetical protein